MTRADFKAQENFMDAAENAIKERNQLRFRQKIMKIKEDEESNCYSPSKTKLL